jgi:hypothetical protein
MSAAPGPRAHAPSISWLRKSGVAIDCLMMRDGRWVRQGSSDVTPLGPDLPRTAGLARRADDLSLNARPETWKGLLARLASPVA